jgi:hypothetical protein
MEDINNRGSTTAIIEKKLLQPRLIIQSLAFTSILYFCVGQTPPNTTGAIYQSVQTSTPLSTSVENSVLQHASRQLGLPKSALRIVHAQPQTWSDNCLGLHDSEFFCTQISVPGWQVAVASGKQSWIYRTNASGSMIKMEQDTSAPSSAPSKERKEVALTSCTDSFPVASLTRSHNSHPV